MLNLELDANDDPDFGRAAQTAVLGVLSVSKPPEVYLVKVGNWFGPKWLAFSHKALGALGIASSDLRVPPFVPARVVHEKYFVRVPEGEDYVSAVAPLTLHVRQTSSANAARRISSLCPHAALFWWTGSTHTTGRGGLMARPFKVTARPDEPAVNPRDPERSRSRSLRPLGRRASHSTPRRTGWAGERRRPLRETLRFLRRGLLCQPGRAARVTLKGLGLMAYVPALSGHAYWYAELTRMTHWRSGAMKGITSDVFATYQAAGEAGQQAAGA
jgi:hypothetical protein